jgi:tetratricopeptide (TPR) repeat protein
MARLLPVLLLLTCCGFASEPRWIKVTSSNFELYTTAGEKKAREAVLHFEQVRGFFLKATGSKPSAKGRVRIVAFQSEKEFVPYRINEGSSAHAGGDREHDEIVMQSIGPEHYPVAVHEYVHILLKPVENLPLWLNEGAAEVYSTLQPMIKKVRFGDVLPGRILELRSEKLIPLETLWAVDSHSPWYNEKEKQRIFYAESWALMHMLFLDDRYRPRFPEFFRQIAAAAPQPDAFRVAFGKGAADIAKDLDDYIHRNRFNAGVFDITLEKSAEEPEARPATPLESGLVLAGILAELNRRPEAVAAYEKLAKEFSKEPAVPEGLAYFAWRSNKTDEARAHFAKAAELGSRNARLYYDYAGLLDDSGAGRPQRIALLGKAVELDPEFRDARIRLAYMLLGEQDYKAALAHLARVKTVEPKEAFQFFHAVAYAHYSLGQKDEARKAAEKAGQYSQNAGDKAAIGQLIEVLNEQPLPTAQVVAQEKAATEPESASDDRVRVVLKRPRKTVIGAVEQVDCLKDAGRLRLRTEGRVLSLLMDDPEKIEVRGTADGKVTLECGPQKPPRTVTVEYETSVNDEYETVGVVRVIAYK